MNEFDRDLEDDLRAELRRSILPPPTPQSLRETVEAMSEQAMARPARRPGLSFPRSRGRLAFGLGATALILAIVAATFAWAGRSNGDAAGSAPTVGLVRAVDPAVTPGPTFPVRAASAGAADVQLLDVTADGGVFVYAKDEGLRVSLDGGVTWSEARPVPYQAGFYQGDFVDASHGWALNITEGAAADVSVYRTSDSGRTWEPAPVGSVALVSNEHADATVHFLDTSHGQVTVRLYDFDNGAERCQMSTSDDGGATWSGLDATPCTHAFQPLVWIGNAVSYTVTGEGASDTSVGIDSLTARVTLDGGRTWKAAPLEIGPSEVGAEALTLVTAADRVRLFVEMTPKNGADWPPRAVAYDSTDNGSTWSQAYSVRLPDHVHVVSPLSFDHWIAHMDDSSTSGTGGRLVETLDGGRTWNAMPGLGFSNVTNMRWWDGQRGVLEVYEPAPCQTGGSAAARSGDPQSQHTIPDNCAGRTSVFVTNDGGRTWHQVPF